MTTDAGWTIYIFNSDTSLFACELSCVRGELTQSYCTPLKPDEINEHTTRNMSSGLVLYLFLSCSLSRKHTRAPPSTQCLGSRFGKRPGQVSGFNQSGCRIYMYHSLYHTFRVCTPIYPTSGYSFSRVLIGFPTIFR